MSKGQLREFKNAMTRDLYQLFEQGVINKQTFDVALNSLSYIHHVRTN